MVHVRPAAVRPNNVNDAIIKISQGPPVLRVVLDLDQEGWEVSKSVEG